MRRSFTHREWEVAELISFGLTEKEISDYLNIAFRTVKTHKKNLFNKTGCRNIANVTRWYIQETSGIRLEPKEPIKKLVSAFMLILVVLSEFGSSEFIRTRTRVRAQSLKTMRAKPRARRSKEAFQFQLA